METDLIFNFTQVNDQLSTAGLLNAEQLSTLKTAGYEVVINLLPAESEYAVKDEAAIIEAQGLEYVYIPVDFSAPARTQYQQFAQALIQSEDKRVMAHCAANYRVSAFYAIYAVSHCGWSADQAYQFIADRWDLEEYPVWKAFVAAQLTPR